MTHIEEFVALYKKFGIELEIRDELKGKKSILLDPAIQEKFVGGLLQSCSIVVFDKDGNFLKQGFLR